MTVTVSTCPRCGSPLPTRALGGVCASCLSQLAVMTPPPPEGFEQEEIEVILESFGEYDLLEAVARGSSGLVFRARQRGLNRIVAVKIPGGGQFSDAGEVQRFRTEAERLAQLDHPGIVPVYEVGEHQGRPFFSMKFAVGGTLAGRGPLPPREAAALTAQAAEAVHFAHQRGVIHRDIKPGNILLDENGAPLVADFGLARKLDTASGMTLPGSALGTPAYMAPEQTESRGPATLAADIYSLGAVLYELLSGRAPFAGDSITGLLLAVREQDPPPLTGAPRDLEIISRKCLEKDPARRYATAQELADDLHRWRRGEPIAARAAGKLERAWRWCRRRPALAACIALLVLLAAGSTFAALTIRHSRDAERAATGSARTRLRASLLAQAHAGRLSGEPRARSQGLQALREAVALAPGRDLRDEAIAHFAMTGLDEPDVFCRHPPDVPDSLRTMPLAAAVSHSGALGAWCVKDGVVVRRLADGAEVLRVPGDPGSAYAVIWSGDDQWLGIEWSSGCSAYSLTERRHAVHAGLTTKTFGQKCAFSPDGRVFAAVEMTWGKGDMVHVFALPSGKVLHTTPADDSCGCVALGQLHPWLAMRGVLRARVRDWQRGEWIVDREPEGLNKPFKVVAMAPDETAAAWGAYNGMLYFSELVPSGNAAVPGSPPFPPEKKTDPARELLFKGLDQPPVDLDYSPDSRLLMSTAWKNQTRLWDSRTGVLLLETRDGMGRRFTRDGRLTFWRPDGLGIWPVHTGGGAYQCLAAHVNHPFTKGAVSFTPGGEWMLGWTDEGVNLCRRGERAITSLPTPAGLKGAVFSPGGDWIIATARGYVLRWPFDVASGRTGELETFAVPVLGKYIENLIFAGRLTLLISEPVGDSNQETTNLHRIEFPAPGKALRELRVTTVAFRPRVHPALSPDGTRLILSPRDNTAGQMVDPLDGHLLEKLSFQPMGAAWSPDGRLLALAETSGDRIIEASTLKEIAWLPRAVPIELPYPAAFSSRQPLGVRFLDVLTLELFDTETFRSLASFRLPEWAKARTAYLEHVAFSPDGEWLIVSGHDTHLWHLPTVRAELAKLGLGW